ncbi:MAG: hypothetical protein JWP13_184 [Candidatus Saccharibacteria bacterium]|nr:hypothetical protein [Candidatus Saccharibacteria bacterium]
MSISLGEEYRRVGSPVPFGETRVTYQDVEPLHDLTVQNFVQASTTQSSKFDFTSSSTAGALFFRSIGEPGIETPNRCVSARVTHDAVPEGWRMMARVATFGRNAGDINGKTIFYRVETIGTEVVEAIKAVGFIFEKSEIVVFDNRPYEKFVAEKIMYERPMNPDDCQRLAGALTQSVHRAPYRTRDPAIDNVCWIPSEFGSEADFLNDLENEI